MAGEWKSSMKTGVALKVALLSIVLVYAMAAWAEGPYNRVEFSVTASREVPNDLGRAVLRVEAEHEDAVALGDEVNERMRWALAQLQAFPAVEPRTGTYQIRGVFNKNRFSHWRAFQFLELRSSDAVQLGAALGRLQSRLQIQAMGFEVSPPRRRAVEDELIGAALASFQARATLIRDNFGARDYRLVNLVVSTSGQGTAPEPSVTRIQRLERGRAVQPPAMAAGKSEVTVTVSGMIELD